MLAATISTPVYVASCQASLWGRRACHRVAASSHECFTGCCQGSHFADKEAGAQRPLQDHTALSQKGQSWHLTVEGHVSPQLLRLPHTLNLTMNALLVSFQLICAEGSSPPLSAPVTRASTCLSLGLSFFICKIQVWGQSNEQDRERPCPHRGYVRGIARIQGPIYGFNTNLLCE